MQILSFQTANSLKELVNEDGTPGVVTFIESRYHPEMVGFIYIASTRNFPTHVSTLVDHNPFPLYLHGYIPSATPENLAKTIQHQWAKYQYRGHWYRPHDDLIGFIRSSARRPPTVPLPNSALAPAETELLNVKELSDRLQISVPTLRRLVASDQIPHIKKGRILRFNLAQVLSALSEKRRQV